MESAVLVAGKFIFFSEVHYDFMSGPSGNSVLQRVNERVSTVVVKSVVKKNALALPKQG